MKKNLLSILISAFCLLLSPHQALAWWIDSYETEIAVEENSSIVIIETIKANFTDDAHHGITRTIPNKIKDEKLRFDLIDITDENGTSLQYEVQTSIDGTTYKIGDPNTLTEEVETYIITYEVENGLSFFEDHDEIYWNAVGSDWQTNILSASAKIILPASITITDEIDMMCYTGPQGGIEQNCTWNRTSANTIEFSTTKSLNPYEALTIVVGFPIGYVSKPIEELLILKDFWPTIIPIIVFAILFSRWKKHGKDEKIETIVPEYKPVKELSPAETSFIAYERIMPKDISATLIDLAIRGHLKIEETKDAVLGIFKFKNYTLYRLKKNEEQNLRPFEKLLMEKLFEEKDQVALSDLKNKFYKHINEIQKEIMNSVVEKKIFEKNPVTAKTIQLVIGSLIAGAGFSFIGEGGFETWKLTLGLSIMICGILTMIFGYYMSKKTMAGNEFYKKILGLKMYIETAEKDRIQFHEKEKHFEELLPYAMVFMQTNHWAKQFEDIYISPPNWYTSAGIATGHSSMAEFTSNMDHAMSSISTALSSRPGGHGSGFSGGSSGGGGGGGGGGAW